MQVLIEAIIKLLREIETIYQFLSDHEVRGGIVKPGGTIEAFLVMYETRIAPQDFHDWVLGI